MKRFILISFLFLLPFIILLLPYFIGDPFKAMRHYDVYYDQSEPFFINNNRGYVSTQMYIQNHNKYHFNSFKFGSSRSGYYRIAQWKKYLPQGSNCFNFDGYGESLYQIHKKILFLDSIDAPINNALICIDQMVLENVEPFYTHLHFLPPALVNNSNYFSFQFAHIRSYLEPMFLRAYWDYFFTRKVKQYMFDSLVFEKRAYDYDESTNETGTSQGEYVPFDSTQYTPERLQSFYIRTDSQTYYSSIIKEKQKALLTDIKNILDKHNTNYKIVINPVYDQKKLSEDDMTFLKSIFGNNLDDFSGINIFTYDYRNYGDLAHFKAYVATEIMKIMYEQDSLLKKTMKDSIYNVNCADIRNIHKPNSISIQ